MCEPRLSFLAIADETAADATESRRCVRINATISVFITGFRSEMLIFTEDNSCMAAAADSSPFALRSEPM